jgi:hypothetical protein
VKSADIGLDLGQKRGANLRRGKTGDKFAFAEKYDAISEIESFIEIVGDEQDGLLEVAEEGEKHVLHLGAGERIEGSKRLIHEQDARLCSQGASEADALALASGKLVGVAASEEGGVQAYGGEQLMAAADSLGAWLAFDFKH